MPKKIKWNIKAFAELRREPEVQAICDQAAEAIAGACNAEMGPSGNEPGFEAESSPHATRARSVVVAAGIHARRHNAKHQTLVHNLDAGRQ